MAASRTIGQGVIVVTANTSQAQAAIAATATASKTATNSIIGNFTNAAKTLNSSPLISTAETISALFIQMGGAVSQVASVVTSLIRPVAVLGTAFGQLLAPVAALALPTAGLAAVAIGLKKIADSGVEAADALDKMGIQVDPGQAARIDMYRDATQQLDRAMSELQVSVAAEVAPALADLVHQVAGSIDEFTRLREAVGGVRTEMSEWADTRLSTITLGMSERLRDLITGHDELADAVAGSTIMEIAAAKAHREAAQAEADEAEGARQNALAKDADREATRLLKEEEQRLAVVREARIAQFRFAADAAEAAAAAEEAASAEVRRQMLEDNDAILASVEEIRDARIKAAEEYEQAEFQANLAAAATFASVAEMGVGAFQQIAQAQADQVASRIAAGERVTDAEKAFANRAMDQAEALAIIQAGIQSTIAGIGIVSNLAPFLGPAAIPVGVTIAGGLYAAAVAGIEAGQPFRYSYDDNDRGRAGDPGDYGEDGKLGQNPEDDNPRADKPDIPRRDTSRSRGGSRVTLDLTPRAAGVLGVGAARPYKRRPR